MGDIDLSCMGRRGQRIHPDDELAQSVLLASVRACSCRVSADSLLDQSPIEGVAGSWIGLSLGPEGEIFCSRASWRSLRLFDVAARGISESERPRKFAQVTRVFRETTLCISCQPSEAHTRGADMKRWS